MLYLQESIYNVKCIVAYDGYDYQGFQIQNDEPTIELELKKALSILFNEDVKIYASGRTDKGVHARGQVINFYTKMKIDECKFKYAFNRTLPHDIRILDLKYVDNDFHARFSAKSKEYRYYIKTKNYDVFESRYSVYIPNLDVERMKDALALFVGTHDFSAFCSAEVDERKSCVKTITKAELNVIGDNLEFVFEGTGFLKYQIRRMMGTIIAIGRGKEDKKRILELFESKSKQMRFPIAPGNGLFLYKVNY